MPNLKFELFELICDELRARSERIITESILSADQLEELKDTYAASDDLTAMKKALEDLSEHFKSKGARIPFGYDLGTGRFWRLDAEFIKFVSDVRSIRGSGLPAAKKFEIQTCNRLSRRLTGLLHQVGAPRKKNKTRAQFVAYLKKLGFGADVLEAKDKDGGFDIIWLPPLGAIPLRPVVSIQCKNSSFNREEAFASVGQAQRSIMRHSHMRASGTYMLGVVFNDYIDQTFEGRAKGWGFVPLGLSDLTALRNSVDSVFLL